LISALTATAALPVTRRRPCVADTPTMQIAHRVAGIEIRKELTDSLQRFSAYVDEQGNVSSGGRGIYIQLSRRINTSFGLSRQMAEAFLANGSDSLRDSCSIMELLALHMLEIDLKNLVDAGMAAGESRDAIKKSLYGCIDTYGHQFADRFVRWRAEA
jgi:hypothetical protein